MIKFLMSKIIGSWHERYLRSLTPLIQKINSLEETYSKMDNDFLFSTTDRLRQRLNKGEDTNDILPDAFAAVRETSKRILNMRHYDVQLIGGYVLHKGQISEMKTGEGKTLVATLALYLNALEKKGAHLVTVNDYLALRDATWMAPIYLKLGLTVGIIQSEKSKMAVWENEDENTVTAIDITRKEAYECDITYGTNNEFGFDYLRDNMKYEMDAFVQRDLHYAIVDEVDSILIDEARTPLIISGPTDETTDKYYNINNIVKFLKKDIHYTVEEKHKSATLTDEGINYVESHLNVGNLFDIQNVDTLHFVNNALKAHAIFKLDVDYVVQNGQVVIVDEFTGRFMSGRRFSDGLHQALEAKEGVQIQNENQTLASITFQNYFRMYTKLSGMTGTALTEAEEFKQIYNLTVVPIPTHKPLKRIDQPDLIYRTAKEKYNAICEEIKRLHAKGQPVLVGTISIEQSEAMSAKLKSMKIPHNTLNAKNHAFEATIVAEAGQQKAVTIATNMAGRGTDIKLGEGVEELGGLYILGTERHESRRIDNQLRGRSGRQGDPGESRFYLSTEDDLLRIFGAQRIGNMMDKLGMEGEPIEHNFISRGIESAQKKVEAMNFEIRKHLLEYDNVANQQRKAIYQLRKEVLLNGDVTEILQDFSKSVSDALYPVFESDHKEAEEEFYKVYQAKISFENIGVKEYNTFNDIFDKAVKQRIEQRKEELGEHFEGLTRFIMIHVIDTKWKEHLLQMDYLRDSVGLRGYGQKDPLIEYKKESFIIFTEMFNRIELEASQLVMHATVQSTGKELELKMSRRSPVKEEKRDIFASGSSDEQNEKKHEPVRRTYPKVGRNDPCPCGSGKKYKHCHGS